MPHTYEAILDGNRVEWMGKAPEHEGPLRVRVIILERQQSIVARGEKMAEALGKLAEVDAFSDIEDPVQWQREIRQDRVLPGRED